VAAGTPEAADAGAEILAAGGNAADAAVAVALTLAVTEPAGSGLGGAASPILYLPGGDVVVIAGPSRAPAELPAGIDAPALRNHQAATVPSFVRVLETLYERFGSRRLSWSRLLAPAIRHAESGIRLGWFRHRSLVRNAHVLGGSASAAGVFLLPDGRIPAPEDVLRQPALARTLRRLADRGAGDFYTGEIARRIARDMEANRGWITEHDLAELPDPEVVPAVAGTYRGWEVYTLPPPSGGWVVMQALNILEQAPGEDLRLTEENRSIWMAEALRAAYRTRRHSPVSDLNDYHEEVRTRISKQTARALHQQIEPPDRGETTHFSIVDGDGLAVGVTQSINSYFGARALAPELGFLYNNYMSEFTTNPAKERHPFALRPRGPAYSCMGAAILARDGAAGLVLGSPGGGRITSAVIQTVSAWVDGRCSVDEAVRAPRMHYIPRTDHLHLERFPSRPSEVLALQRRGFAPTIPVTTFRRNSLDSYFGGIHAVAREQGEWVGAADPRRDGAVRVAPLPGGNRAPDEGDVRPRAC